MTRKDKDSNPIGYEALEKDLMQGRIDRRKFLRLAMAAGVAAATTTASANFIQTARANQLKQASELKKRYDYIVCGAGSSGCVVARRLAENPNVSVLLLEAGPNDDVPSVQVPIQWITNLGTARDWGFKAEPSEYVNGRSIALNMGKTYGGGSSVNVMIWSRGHKNDWDYFAKEAGDDKWNYKSVLDIYKRIEDWTGEPDPARRGKGGMVHVEPCQKPNPVAPAFLKAAASVGIPTFADQNSKMMEGTGGAAIANVRIKDGKRVSVFRTYVYPFLDRPNLTVLPETLVTRLLLDGNRAQGVEIENTGSTFKVEATKEVILSMGAMNTPKVLMQSGIGDQAELKKFNIPVVQHLPGVGQNFQDHFMAGGCLWEYNTPQPPRNQAAEATFFWKSAPSLDTPDLQPFQIEVPFASQENLTRFKAPSTSWSLPPAVVRPHSRGEIKLSGPKPSDPIKIYANYLKDERDMKAILKCVEICRDIGNSAALKPFVKREVMPGNLKGKDLEKFVRDGVLTYWHQTCTAKMGRDNMSVVDGNLSVYGIKNLRIADGSIMPRVTTGNTMAPCVVIGERMAEILRA